MSNVPAFVEISAEKLVPGSQRVKGLAHLVLHFSFFLDQKKKKNLNSSNFFVFQSYEPRFSGIFCSVLIRSFPGCFVKNSISRGVPHESIVDSKWSDDILW